MQSPWYVFGSFLFASGALVFAASGVLLIRSARRLRELDTEWLKEHEHRIATLEQKWNRWVEQKPLPKV